MQADVEYRKGTELGELRISEMYCSLQGEGLLTGTPSIFVRTSGCNLRCWFCDTPFASWHPEGDHLTVAQIVAETRQFKCEHVVITGGEPMIFPALVELTEAFQAAGQHVTIETAGTLALPVICDLMSISPKLSSSAPKDESSSWYKQHHHRRERLEVVAQMMQDYEYQLKFVVDAPQDAEEVLSYLELLEANSQQTVERDRVLLMPQGTEQDTLDQQAQWLLPWCQNHDLRFCQRAHIAWFGNQRGT